MPTLGTDPSEVAAGSLLRVRVTVSTLQKLVAAAIVSWQGADEPLLFDIGVLAEAPFFVLTFYLFLAFPMGRLEPRATRWIMGVLVLGVLAFFLPWALFSPVIAGGGPLTRCAAACPENVLQIGSAPKLVEVA